MVILLYATKERSKLIDFSQDTIELANFIDKILDKYDNQPSVYHTGIIYRYFRNFKYVNTAEHGRGGNELENSLEYEEENCYIPV